MKRKLFTLLSLSMLLLISGCADTSTQVKQDEELTDQERIDRIIEKYGEYGVEFTTIRPEGFPEDCEDVPLDIVEEFFEDLFSDEIDTRADRPGEFVIQGDQLKITGQKNRVVFNAAINIKNYGSGSATWTMDTKEVKVNYGVAGISSVQYINRFFPKGFGGSPSFAKSKRVMLKEEGQLSFPAGGGYMIFNTLTEALFQFNSLATSEVKIRKPAIK